MTGSEYQDIQRRVSDSVVQSRGDRRTLATLTTYFVKEKGYFVSISDIVNQAQEMLMEILVRNEMVEEILSTEDAVRIMDFYTVTNLNPQARNRKALLSQLKKESIFLDGGDPSYIPQSKHKTKDMSEIAKTNPKLDAMLDDKEYMSEQMEKARADQIRRDKEQAETKAGLKNLPANVVKKEEE